MDERFQRFASEEPTHRIFSRVNDQNCYVPINATDAKAAIEKFKDDVPEADPVLVFDMVIGDCRPPPEVTPGQKMKLIKMNEVHFGKSTDFDDLDPIRVEMLLSMVDDPSPTIEDLILRYEHYNDYQRILQRKRTG